MKKIIMLSVVLSGVVFLTACGRPWADVVEEDIVVDPEANVLYIDTSPVDEIQEQPQVTKIAKISWASDVTVTSQAGGRVWSIFYDEWDNVIKWSMVISLIDSNVQFSFADDRARNSLDSAKLNYEQTRVSLDNSLSEAQLAIKRAEQWLKAARDDAEQQRIQAEYNRKTSDPSDEVSSANLQLQKLEGEIKKAQFDAETKVAADNQTLVNFVNSSQNIQDTVFNLYDTVLDKVDGILWFTSLRRSENDVFETYLSARNTQLKRDADTILRKMLQDKALLQTQKFEVSNVGNLSSQLSVLQWYVNELTVILNKMDQVLDFSITASDFPQTQLDWLKATIDGFQSQVIATDSQITQSINGIQAFLATYEQWQQSVTKQIALLEEQREIVRAQLRDANTSADIWKERVFIWTDNAVASAELALESAKNAYETTLRTKQTTLASLSNSIDQAQVWLTEASAQAGKLTIEAPISWEIGSVLVDEWEEISPGTPLFTMTTTSEQEVVFGMNSDEKKLVKVGTSVTVKQDGKELRGAISSISDIADENLLYKTTVKLLDLSEELGDVVSVELPLSSIYTLLPLDLIDLQTSKSGSVWVWNGQMAEKMDVELWDVRWSSIEVRSDLRPELEIITSPMNNYDPEVNEAKKK